MPCRRARAKGCWIRTAAAGLGGRGPGPADAGVAARQAALEILRAVRRGRTLDVALDAGLTGLDDADRGLAHEVAAGVLRSRTELDMFLAERVSARWNRVEDDIKDLLRIGAYQLTKLERVPAHAAVNTAVELAKRFHGAKSGRFVNAVLRRAAREADGMSIPSPGAARGDAASLAARYSHPDWLVARWLGRYGVPRTEALLEHNNCAPMVHLQPVRWTRTRLRDALADRGIEIAEPDDDRTIGVRGERIRELPGYDEGGFIVQDPAQASALAHAAVPAGALVWDACAAPGGKTAMLSRRCRVLASDRSRDRLERLRATVMRATPGIPVFAADAAAPPLAPASADAVILDVPCTATGTFAKHPDARWRLSPKRLAAMTALQARLLAGTAAIVRPGGILVYMTCSLEPEENGVQVDAFLASRPDFGRTAEDLSVFPPDAGTDGAFAARLERVS